MKSFENEKIYISIENPLKTWWKARKYFKFPNLGVYFSSTPLIDCNKIIYIKCRDVLMENFNLRGPKIVLKLFNLSLHISLNMSIIIDSGEKMEISSTYWEYLIDYIQNDTLIPKRYIWTYLFSNLKYKTPVPIAPQIFSLNKRGLKKLQEEINKLNREITVFKTDIFSFIKNKFILELELEENSAIDLSRKLIKVINMFEDIESYITTLDDSIDICTLKEKLDKVNIKITELSLYL